MKGSHTRIRRVKVIDWGTKSASVPCYAVVSITSDPDSTLAESTDDAGIEECMALAPYGSSAGPVTAFYSGAVPGFQKVKESFGRSPYIRRCYVDGTETLADTDMRALGMNSCAAGVVEGNEIHHCRVGGPFADARSTRSIVARGNACYNVANGPLWDLGRLSLAESVSQLSRNGSLGFIFIKNLNVEPDVKTVTVLSGTTAFAKLKAGQFCLIPVNSIVAAANIKVQASAATVDLLVVSAAE